MIWKAQSLQLFSLVLMIKALWTPSLLGQGQEVKTPEIVGEVEEVPEAPESIDFGVMGEVFPILEQNLIEVILQKLQKLQADGKLELYQKQIQDRVKNGIERPNSVKDVIHTQTPRSYTFDPSIIVTKDLKDQNGTVFYKSGTKVNPLTIRPMTKPLLLVDGDETDHLTWAFKMLKTYPLAKIIFVKGTPLKIMKEIGLTVYFDQQGVICKKFGIKQVPALISQKDDLLLIQEMKAEDIFQTKESKKEEKQ